MSLYGRFAPKNMRSKLPKKWVKGLEHHLSEIERLITLKTARFSAGIENLPYPTNEEEADAFVKSRIKIWLTNITEQVEAIKGSL